MAAAQALLPEAVMVFAPPVRVLVAPQPPLPILIQRNSNLALEGALAMYLRAHWRLSQWS